MTCAGCHPIRNRDRLPQPRLLGLFTKLCHEIRVGPTPFGLPPPRRRAITRSGRKSSLELVPLVVDPVLRVHHDLVVESVVRILDGDVPVQARSGVRLEDVA